MSLNSSRDVLVPWFPRLEGLELSHVCCYLPKGREITSQGVGKESFVIRSETHLVYWHLCVGTKLKTIRLSLSNIYLLNHSAKFGVLRCQSNTNRIRVVLKISDRTKIACTQTFRLNWSRNRCGNEWHAPIPINFDCWKWENTWPSCLFGKPYSLKNRTTMRPCRILPKWFSGISQVWFSGFLARCLIRL